MARLLSRSKGLSTWGHTHDEALANLREAIDLYVQDLIEAGEEFLLIRARSNCRNQPLLSMYDAHTARDFSSTTRRALEQMGSCFNASVEAIVSIAVPMAIA